MHPGADITFVPVTTEADRRLAVPIAEIGGKGVFAKEVQYAVLDGRADCAVHSAKDLTATTIDGLVLAAVPERGDARDAIAGLPLAQLAQRATVGTGSARRHVQLRAMRPDLQITGIRGNIAKRLEQLDALDAIVVAAVALERLGLSARAAQVFSVDEMVPQVGQGALAVECRSDDDATIARLASIEDPTSRLRVDMERAYLARLGGDCALPAGAHAIVFANGTVQLTGMLAHSTESQPIRLTATCETNPAAARATGEHLADALRAALDATP